MAKVSTTKITKKFVDNLAFSESGQALYWDSELRGFGVVVGMRTKTYVAQRDINGRTRRVTVGRHGVIPFDEARNDARDYINHMSKGIDINAQKREARDRHVTLEQAMEIHFEKLRREEKAENTIADYTNSIDRYLGDWRKRPLTDISRSQITDRHTRIGKEHGQVSANRTMRAYRAIYNTARKKYEYLPECPTLAINWYKQNRRQEPIADLAAWYAKVMQIDNGVRRDWQLFTLFTGLRKTDACTIRWEDVNMKEASLHRPNPKGGKERAFTIPLSDISIEILKRRKVENPKFFGNKCAWVFPTRDKNENVTHMQEPKEYKRGLPSPHRLRDSYSSACNAAGLTPFDLDTLTNHRPPKGSVSAGYVRQDLEHLRLQQQKVADYLKGKLGIGFRHEKTTDKKKASKKSA